jgi:hypothetical protein
MAKFCNLLFFTLKYLNEENIGIIDVESSGEEA